MAARTASTTTRRVFPQQTEELPAPTLLSYIVVPHLAFILPGFRLLHILGMGLLGWAFLRTLLFGFLALGSEKLKDLMLIGFLTWRHCDFFLSVKSCFRNRISLIQVAFPISVDKRSI